MGLKHLKNSVAAAALALALPAFGQVLCTMPNGVVITQKLSSTCPAGATKGQTFTGKPVPTTPPTPIQTPTPAAQAPIAKPSPPPADSSYDYAQAICVMLKGAGATTCEINSNIFSTSTIEATLATTPTDAAQTCRYIAGMTRSKKDAFKTKNWELKIFSPFSGNRPIGACDL